jgi:tetratricopeptide (TPR) repeat protein/2-polyprenyl-3-methyl-5-hydroxy-6-metoxy-1,4-benzoquinol methylase
MPQKPRPGSRTAEAERLFATAVQLHQAGHLQDAERHYRQLLATDPKHADALHLLGVLAHQVGRPDGAVELIGKALAINERAPQMHYNIGLAYGALGRFEEAARHNARAVALQPDYAEAHLNLGNALRGQGRSAEAIASYERALALRPSPQAHTNLANMLADLGRADEAIAQYREALTLHSNYADAHNNLGVALAAQGHLAEAAEHHRRAAEISPAMVPALVNLGNVLRALGKPDEAIAWYRRAIERDPNHAEAHNNLGGALMTRGDFAQAAACFERALALKPDLIEASINFTKMLLVSGDIARALEIAHRTHARHDTAETRALFYLCLRDPRALPHAQAYRDNLVRALDEPWGNPRPLAGITTHLVRQNPAIRDAIARVEAAWPRLLPAGELFGADGLAPVAADRVLCALLESTLNNDVGLERFLTSARATLLTDALNGADPDGDTLAFACALARHCFINEYVFAYPSEEAERVGELQDRVAAALAGGTPVPAFAIAALAAHVPLHTLPFASALAHFAYAAPLRAVLTQQIDEPQEEARIRTTLPRLTAIEDAGSQAVRAQYEENPYPRWTGIAPLAKPQSVDSYLRDRFPLARLRASGLTRVEYLIAGCGTGQQVASVKLSFSNVDVTAIDLSLASLGYARRMIEKLGMRDIAFGQADILELASLVRTFDVIDSSGVLHHLADTEAGWKVLLSLLRPGGIMRVALYSMIARHDIEAVRRAIAARGLTGTAADIRQMRQEIMAMPDGRPERNAMKIVDFFSTSDCRDLLFHVQERTFTIPELKAFFTDNGLEFLGFECDPGTIQQYDAMFPDDPAHTDLDRWHAFEQASPDTFLAMYEFWLQKRQ